MSWRRTCILLLFVQALIIYFLIFLISGPVQFERDEEDPFGLDQFLDTAKRASGANKRGNDDDR